MAKSEVAAMRAEIARLTGRVPVSHNLETLQLRLEQLQSTPAYHIRSWRRELVIRMAASASISPDALVRRALDEYAVKHGFGHDVERCGRGDK